MRRPRILLFAILFAATCAVGAVVRRRGGPGGAADDWLVPLGVFGAVWAAAVVVDVVWHAWKGDGQSCRSCGHVRPMKSFRPAGPCPRCGA